MIKSEIPRRRGRTPAVKFPIVRHVMDGDVNREKVMEAGTKVRCLRCGETFTVDRLTTRYSSSALDDTPYIRCELCHYTASVLDYFDRVVVPPEARPKRRTRTPEDVIIIRTPEG